MFSQDVAEGKATAGRTPDAGNTDGRAAILALQVMGPRKQGGPGFD